MAAKFIQTSLESEPYKSLRIAAVKREMGLADLIRDIILDWLFEEARKEKKNGRGKSEKST